MSEIVDCIAWIVRKTCWSCYIFFKFIFLRFLDLLGLIFNILACLTVIRLPCMIRQFLTMTKLTHWRVVGLVQLLIFFQDIPFLLMGAAVILFTLGLVCIPMAQDIREKSIKCDYTHQNGMFFYGGFKLRSLVANYFFKHVSGLLCIPLLLVTLLTWRSVIVVRKLRAHTYFDWGWRKHIVIQFFQLFVDIPCVFAAVFVVLSWRLLFYVRNVKKVRKDDHKGWNTWRLVAFKHFGLLFVDLFCFFLFAITFFTWRCPFMIIELRDDCSNQWEARSIVVRQFCLIFVDVPCILCFVLVLVTLWRLPRFVKNHKNDQWEVRMNCVYQAGMMCVDFACFLLFIVVLSTLWRLYPLVRDIRKYRKRAGHSETLDATLSSEAYSISRPSSWKIRKSICKHFGLLFVDLPAIAVFCLILLTAFRFPTTLSKLLQSGDFYAEFAMIVFVEAGKLLVDIVFLLVFVFLIIIRPVASWVRLLEDEEHAQYRHACFYMNWIPDMINDIRTRLPVAMEEEFSACLKTRVSVVEARVRMSFVCQEYLKQWKWLHDKVLQDEIFPELPHLITMVMWHENRRPYKMSRLYNCELLYLMKPVPRAHDEALSKHQREMVEYEERVTFVYKDLENFAPPKVPLWSNRCGLSTRSRRETQQVLMRLPGGNLFVFLLIVVNLLFIYRGPRLLLNLYHRWYDRRGVVFRSCKEYLSDALTFIRILIVVLLIYRAPALLLDIAIDIVSKQSWKAVRVTAARYPLEIIDDFRRLISLVFHWRSVRFLFTAIVFGILIPADLLLTVFKYAIHSSVVYPLTGALFLLFLVFPISYSFKFGEMHLNDGYDKKISYIVGGYCFATVVLLVVLIVILLKHRQDKFSVAPKPYQYVRVNWGNTHVVVFEIVELLQLLALVFSLNGIPMVGSGVLNTYSSYLLFNFTSFEMKLVLTVLGFLVWFIVCGAPVIFEHILKQFPEGKCAGNDGWRLLMVLFCNTLFVSMVEGLCGLVSCDYVNVCQNNATLYANNTTSCHTSYLRDEHSIECWVGGHQGIAWFGLWGLFWYTTTSIIYGTQYGDVDSQNVDIEFSPVYNTMVNFLKAVMVGAVVLFPGDFYFVLACLLLLGLLAIFVTIFFKSFFGYASCNSVVVSYFRVASFVIFNITVLAVLVAKVLDDEDSYTPLIVFLAGAGGTLLVASIASLLHRLETMIEKDRRAFRRTLLALEKKLDKDGYLVHSWKNHKRQWRRLVRHVYQAHKLDRNVDPESWEKISAPETDVASTAPPIGSPPPVSPGEASFDPKPPSYDETLPTTSSTSMPTENPDQLPVPFVPLEDAHELHTFISVQDDKPTNDGEIADVEVDVAILNSDQSNTDPIAIIAEVMANINAVTSHSPPETYDAEAFLKNEVWLVQRIEENKTMNERTSMAKLQCNGKNLLLFLESFVHFRAFSFAFVSQIPLWREAVTGSNWTGLLHCLQVLEKALSGNYDQPTEFDVSLGDNSIPTCVLAPDPDQEVPPVFVAEPRDPESIKNQSDSERTKALGDIGRVYSDEPIWLSVFEKVLPTVPVIRKWKLDEESNSFELVLRRSCQGAVVDVGPKGIKLAKGAVIDLPKIVKGTLTKQRLEFQKRFEPIGKKGPISITVSEILIQEVSDKVYLYSNGKKVNAEKALDSLKTIKWS